jgi:hypothetical protein
LYERGSFWCETMISICGRTTESDKIHLAPPEKYRSRLSSSFKALAYVTYTSRKYRTRLATCSSPARSILGNLGNGNAHGAHTLMMFLRTGFFTHLLVRDHRNKRYRRRVAHVTQFRDGGRTSRDHAPPAPLSVPPAHNLANTCKPG